MRTANEWFKPERLTAYYYTYEALAAAALLTGVGIVLALGGFANAPLWVIALVGIPIVVVFGYFTWWIPAFYRTAAYRLTDDEIEYRRGVFFQQKSTVPYNRITNVTAAQGPIQRVVDAGAVGIHTAGYGGQMGAELTIGGISDFEDVRDQVMEKVRRRRPIATEGEEQEAEPTTESTPLLVELRRIRELLERQSTE